MQVELLSIDLSNYCSKQCPFCYNHSTRKGNVLWKPQEVIDFALDCANNGVHAVSLGGGEPFEYDGIFDVIDAIVPHAYLSVTTNGLPLGKSISWEQLALHKPDKIHISLHNPGNNTELDDVITKIEKISQLGIKPGCNLLVSNKNLEEAKGAYSRLLKVISSDQIIVIPLRFQDTPSPNQLSYVTGGKPFQSPSCILSCRRPEKFASVSWDKKVNSCSYALGKQPLETLDYKGMIDALNRVVFKSCTSYED